MVNNAERDELLAFVAEKYYQEDKKQTEIASICSFPHVNRSQGEGAC